MPRSGGVLDALPTGQAFLYCFNDNGDSLWFKKFSSTDTTAKTEFYDVIATADSGILACGQILFSNGQQKSYLVKLDANGNLYNPLNVVEKKKQTYLHLYPNPASNYTSIHYMGVNKNSVLAITNLQGQEVYKKKLESNDERLIINLEMFAEGFYICTISKDGRTLENKKLVITK